MTSAALLAAAGCATTRDTAGNPVGMYGSSPSNSIAQPYSGVVTRVDVPQRVVVMSDGRMYQVPADSVVYVNGQPLAYSAIQPGTQVVLNNGQLVELRDGRYVVVPQPATAVAGYKQTIQGVVTDVDRNEIRVRTANDRFEIPMRDANRTGIKKGDNVIVDVTFTPAAPAALPR